MELLQADWFESPDNDTTEVNPSQLLTNAKFGYAVTVTSGDEVANRDFGNYQYATKTGTKFLDYDGDGGAHDPDGNDDMLGNADDEVGLENWEIRAYVDDSMDGDLDQAEYDAGPAFTTMTDVNGDYTFDELMPGVDYLIVEVQQDGYHQTFPGASSILDAALNTGMETLGADGYAINLDSQEVDSGNDFGNFEGMDVSGWKWADIEDLGVWNMGEEGLNGVTIVLDDDENPDNGTIRTTVTADNMGMAGYYEFLDISPDELGGATTLFVYEIVPNGFTQTFGGFSFDVASGTVISGTKGVAEEGNFGNNMMEGANRTPGFWQSTLGQSFYNGDPNDQGDSNGDGVPDGNKDFEEEGWCEDDLLLTYGVDVLDANGNSGMDGELEFFLWDENGDGVYDAGTDIALSVEELVNWVSGDGLDNGTNGGRSFVEILMRDMGASFLNTLNNDCIAGGSDVTDGIGPDPDVDMEIADSYADAAQFIQDWGGGGSKKQQKADWNAYGNAAHKELDGYNNNGTEMTAMGAEQFRFDGDDFRLAVTQNYIDAENAYEAYQAGLVTGDAFNDGEKVMEADSRVFESNAVSFDPEPDWLQAALQDSGLYSGDYHIV